VPVYFVDTSALVKRYVREVGSTWLRATLDPGQGARVYLLRLTGVELIAALTRRERGGTLATADAAAARSSFQRDFATEYQIVEATEALIGQAMLLAEQHGLRGYDAIQLAGGLGVNETRIASGLPPLILLSADVELNAAATAEGLPVEDPNAHP
jgi:predicted nucleic acid-binding protein